MTSGLQNKDIGRVNLLLRGGLKRIDRAPIKAEIRESRALAAVWYARLALPLLERWINTPTGAWRVYKAQGTELTTLVPEAQAQLAVIEDALGDVRKSTHLPSLYVEFIPLLFSLHRSDLPNWEETLVEYRDRYDRQWDLAKFWRICDLATVDYRLKSPMSRATRRCQNSDTQDQVRGLGTVVCAYCKERLCDREVGSGRDHTRETNPHTISCGLWFLAFDEPVHPTKDRVIRQSENREVLRVMARGMDLCGKPNGESHCVRIRPCPIHEFGVAAAEAEATSVGAAIRASLFLSWTGPHEGELDDRGRLTRDLPPERWPYCIPSEHDSGCTLRVKAGARGSFCDCGASAEDEE